jgi:hypothetical protein
MEHLALGTFLIELLLNVFVSLVLSYSSSKAKVTPKRNIK